MRFWLVRIEIVRYNRRRLLSSLRLIAPQDIRSYLKQYYANIVEEMLYQRGSKKYLDIFVKKSLNYSI